jgi:flavodoxin
MTYKEVIIVTSIWYDEEEPFPEGDSLTTIIEELVNEGNYEIRLLRDLP